MPRSRARALIGLAAALAGGELVLDAGADPADGPRRGCSPCPGSAPGRPTYVAMRALGDRDAFLPTDLGVRRALERARRAGGARRAPRALAERWRPYRAYALQHLWSTLN